MIRERRDIFRKKDHKEESYTKREREREKIGEKRGK